MITATPRLETAIREHLAPVLRADGFRGTGRSFRRVVNGWVQVVNVRGSRYGDQFAKTSHFIRPRFQTCEAKRRIRRR